MKAEATIKPATRVHCVRLARQLRAEDRAELTAIGMPNPRLALEACLRASTLAFTLEVDGEIGAMVGCGPAVGAPSRIGWVWFLTGEPFKAHPRPYMRVARRVTRQLLERYPVLVNLIDARYEAAVRWAKWLGFSVGTPVPHGPAGMPFHPARLEAH